MNYCVWWEKSAGLGAAFFIHRLCQSCGLCKAGGHWEDPRHQGKSTSCSRWAPWTTSVCDSSWPLGRVSVLVFMYIVSCRLGTKSGGWWTYWPCSAYEEAQGLRTAVCFCLSVAVLRIRKTFYRFTCLNTWFPLGGSVWEGAGGVASLEVCHWVQTFKF